MENLTKSDIDILFRQNDQTLAEWWLFLNSWGWPDVLLNPEPTTYIPDGRRIKLLNLIEKTIGNRLIDRIHFKTLGAEEGFEVFYKGQVMGCQEYQDEYFKQLGERADRHEKIVAPERMTVLGEKLYHGFIGHRKKRIWFLWYEWFQRKLDGSLRRIKE